MSFVIPVVGTRPEGNALAKRNPALAVPGYVETSLLIAEASFINAVAQPNCCINSQAAIQFRSHTIPRGKAVG
jgi:hypothetical protein